MAFTAPLMRSDVEAGLARLEAPVAKLELLDREDAYYYGHHGDVALPVWRAVLDDSQRTRIYIDAVSGEVARIADGPAKRYRWLQSGLRARSGLRRDAPWGQGAKPIIDCSNKSSS